MNIWFKRSVALLLAIATVLSFTLRNTDEKQQDDSITGIVTYLKNWSAFLVLPEIAEHRDTIRKLTFYGYDYEVLYKCWYFSTYPDKVDEEVLNAVKTWGHENKGFPLVASAIDFKLGINSDVVVRYDLEYAYFDTFLDAFNASAGGWYTRIWVKDKKTIYNSCVYDMDNPRTKMDYTPEECLFLAYLLYNLQADKEYLRSKAEEYLVYGSPTVKFEIEMFDTLDSYKPSAEMWKRFRVTHKEFAALLKSFIDVCKKYDFIDDEDNGWSDSVTYKYPDNFIQYSKSLGFDLVVFADSLPRDVFNSVTAEEHATIWFASKFGGYYDTIFEKHTFPKKHIASRYREILVDAESGDVFVGDYARRYDNSDHLERPDNICFDFLLHIGGGERKATPTPTPKPTPTAAPTKSPTTAPTKAPTAVPTPTGTVKATPTSEITPAVTDTPTPTAEITPVEEPSPTEEPVITDIPVTAEPSPTEAPTEVEVTEIPTPEPTATEVPAEISPSSEPSDISDETDGAEGDVSTPAATSDPAKSPAVDPAKTEPVIEDKESTPLTPWIVVGAVVLVVAAAGVVIGVKTRKKQ